MMKNLANGASASPPRGRLLYEFGPYRVDPAERQFLREGIPIPLTTKAFDTLLLLLEQSNHLVEKSEIMAAIWPDSFVEESNLSVTIWMLRKALGGRREGNQYIQTVPKRGYRFVAEVKENYSELDLPKSRPAELAGPTDSCVWDEAAAASPPPPAIQEQAERVESSLKAGRSYWRPVSARIQRLALLAVTLLVAAGAVIHYRSPSFAATTIRSLAVLPFETLNSPKGQEYMGIDITDSVITRLGSLDHLQVRPTRAVLQYSSPSADPRYIGRAEKVDAVLVGSVDQRAQEILVNVQLIRVADGVMLWAHSFEDTPEHMSALEDGIANEIDNLSSIHASAEKKVPPMREETENREAYRLYLEGRYFWNKRTENGLRRSIEYFQQATLADDHYAEAYAGLADSYALLGSYGIEPAERAYPNAKAAALRALELDNSLAEAHTSLGLIDFYYAWEWTQAGEEFQRSLAINPDYAMTHMWYAVNLVAQARNGEAIMEIQKAEDLDPMSLIINTEVGRVFYLTHQYDRAMDAYQKVIDLDPEFARAHTRLGMVYLAKKDFAGAIQEFEKAKGLTGPDPYLDGLTGYAQASSGNVAPARALLKSLDQRSHREFVPAFSMALICIGLGDRERALDLLTKSFEDRSTYMVYAKVDPLLDPLRSDPRFVDLLKRMKLS